MSFGPVVFDLYFSGKSLSLVCLSWSEEIPEMSAMSFGWLQQLSATSNSRWIFRVQRVFGLDRHLWQVGSKVPTSLHSSSTVIEICLYEREMRT